MADSNKASDYLVVGDPKKPSTWHLQVKRNGVPDHGLMGAAWAALTSNHRGNAYAGPNKSEALAKLRRLYASEKMPVPAAHMESDGALLIQFDWKLKGAYPDVPLNESVDETELRQLDNLSSDEAVFLTLPLGRVGMKAKDGFVYTEGFINKLLQHMTSQATAGNMGHVAAEDRASKFPMPVSLWVGAAKDETGMLWGKAYLRDAEFRNYVKQTKAANGSIATSVYGTYDPSTANYKLDGSYEIDPSTFKLESVDFAPPARAALQFNRQMAITSHMESNEMTKEELLSQLTADEVPTELREQIISQFKEAEGEETVLAQLTAENAEKDKVIGQLTAALAETNKTALTAHMDARLTEAIKVDNEEGSLREMVRDRVVSHISADMKPEDVEKLITEVTETASYKALAQMIVVAKAGGKVSVQGGDNNAPGKTPGEIAEENAAQTLSAMGINFN